MKLEPIHCLKANDYMMKYMDGDITDNEAKRLKDHIDRCDDCREDFKLYDFILDELSVDTELSSPPEGFTAAVMVKVEAVPAPRKLINASFDSLLCGVWGVFSVVFGVGFLLVLNREQILDYFSGIPALSGYVAAIMPMSERISAFFSGLVASFGQFFVSAGAFLSSYRYWIFGIFAALVVCQYFVNRRSKNAVKAGGEKK